MYFLRKIGLYKWINIILFLIGSLVLGYMYINYNSWCKGKDIYCYYNFYDAIYNPLYFGVRILTVLLGMLLFVPTHIFRKWLFYVAPIIIVITIWRVQSISVYSSGIATITKANMAQIGMYFLALVTTLFVLGHLAYDYRKKKQLQK